MSNLKYYAALGLKPGASEAEIKRAYKMLALEHHPDRNYGNEKNAQEEFVKVQAAYDALLKLSKHKTSIDDAFTENPNDVSSTGHHTPRQRRPRATSPTGHKGEPRQRRTRAHSRQNDEEEPYKAYQHPHFDPYDDHQAQPEFGKTFEPRGSPHGDAPPYSYSRKDENRVHWEEERSRSRDRGQKKYPPSSYPRRCNTSSAGRSCDDGLDEIKVRINRVHITVDNREPASESSRSNSCSSPSESSRVRSNTKGQASPTHHRQSRSSSGRCHGCGESGAGGMGHRWK